MKGVVSRVKIFQNNRYFVDIKPRFRKGLGSLMRRQGQETSVMWIIIMSPFFQLTCIYETRLGISWLAYTLKKILKYIILCQNLIFWGVESLVTWTMLLSSWKCQNRGSKKKGETVARIILLPNCLLGNHSTMLQNTFSVLELGSDSKRHLDIWCSPSLIRKAFYRLFNSMHI